MLIPYTESIFFLCLYNNPSINPPGASAKQAIFKFVYLYNELNNLNFLSISNILKNDLLNGLYFDKPI